MQRIGITTTVPVEIIYAAGYIPVDLNNIFITSERRNDYIRAAERDGYPRNVCAWIKGMYGVCMSGIDLAALVAVTQGDCSNTHALMETLQLKGIRSIPFAYPHGREHALLSGEMERLAEVLGTDMDAAERERKRLEPIRRDLDHLDDLTWRDGRVTGRENHYWLVSSSDFFGDPDGFSRELTAFISEAEKRDPQSESLRLAYIGVPPILDDLYDTVESCGGRVVFNEVQRQFSMPERQDGIVEQYRAYTYPYSIFHRLDYIRKEIERRRIQGVIHYVQSFCHRHIEDLIVRQKLDIPVLTIEGESPGAVDPRTNIRVQAFLEMLSAGDV